MASQHRKILNLFAFKRAIIPVIIGIVVIGYLIFKDFEKGNFSGLHFNFQSVLFLLLAIAMLLIRDIAYIYRIRTLTNNKIKISHAIQVILLWEFASCVTPSVVGGSAIAVFILYKEKISLGRSAAIVLVASLLDELFYLLMVPITFAFAQDNINSIVNKTLVVGNFNINTLFYFGYFFIAVLTTFICYGIFINPKGVKSLINKIGSWKIFKKHSKEFDNTGNQLINASDEMRGMSYKFWAKAVGSTFASWTARFLMVNFLVMAFVGPINFGNNILILARQLLMWVVMLVSPTPGSSGVAEFFFPIFLGDFIKTETSDFSTIIALLWRVLSYYPYLIIGAFILPFWLRRVYLGRKLIKFKK